MKNSYKKLGILIIGCFLTLGLTGCNDNEPNEPIIDSHKKSTLLIYAVATNSLTGNLISDKNEMLLAAKDIDLNANNILIFETQYKYLENNTRIGNVNLLKLVKAPSEAGQNEPKFEWEIVKEYNDGIASLDPNRVTEIIDYVSENYKADKLGLVLWSHSTASQPYFPDFSVRSDSDYSVSIPAVGSFGQDLSIDDDLYRYMNIEDLASAIPDHLFDYIWFDSCYMSNIESIYQLKDKCTTYVGYPTEVLEYGLPYHLVLPYMVGDKLDLIKAADLFYQYYANTFGTIAVVDMTRIEELADLCREFYQVGTNLTSSNLFKYTRYTTGPFYDFGDYTKSMAKANGVELSDDEWDSVLNECVLYKAASERDLTNARIDPKKYSGISTHLYSFQNEDSQSELYYKSLDWFQRVFVE